MSIIPFYGAEDRALFAIERSAMDRPGKVIAALDRMLPANGWILDVGAGDGFTIERLRRTGRWLVGVEPADGMIDPDRPATWVRAVAQHLPFGTDTFAAAYSTWAYFFPALHDVAPGLAELNRVVRRGGRQIIVDNAGDDEFSAMAATEISADLDFWQRCGFAVEIVETAFVFDSLADAERLLRHFFGERAVPARKVQFRVALMVK